MGSGPYLWVSRFSHEPTGWPEQLKLVIFPKTKEFSTRNVCRETGINFLVTGGSSRWKEGERGTGNGIFHFTFFTRHLNVQVVVVVGGAVHIKNEKLRKYKTCVELYSSWENAFPSHLGTRTNIGLGVPPQT